LTYENTNWSKLLRELRQEKKLTQKELAYKSKMPQRTIAEYENVGAARQLSIYKIEQILDALGYEIDVFLKVKDV
jgi:transcriptional regulator with XRE-family HTH domain|tara:strand:- start:765 stop:989 length:225 start_codon:yes stop_codon:yes gene_type:complete